MYPKRSVGGDGLVPRPVRMSGRLRRRPKLRAFMYYTQKIRPTIRRPKKNKLGTNKIKARTIASQFAKILNGPTWGPSNSSASTNLRRSTRRRRLSVNLEGFTDSSGSEDEDLLEISKKASESKSHDEHPHYMGSASYAQNEPSWRTEGAYPTTSSPEGSSTSLASISDIRTMNWLKERSKIDAQGQVVVPNEKTRKVKENIQQWQSRADQGEFMPSRYDDVLNNALDRKENPGCSLRLDTNTGIKYATRSGHRNISSHKNMFGVDPLVFEAKVRDAVMSYLKSLGVQVFSQKLQNGFQYPTASAKNSCQSGASKSLIGLEGIHKCKLTLLIDGMKTIVAHGTVNFDRTLLHNTSIPLGYVCVSVDGIISEYKNMSVPVPTKYIQSIAEAAGSFIQWPRNLVIVKEMRTFNPKAYSAMESVCQPTYPNFTNLNPKNQDSENLKNELGWRLTRKCKMLKSMLNSYE